MINETGEWASDVDWDYVKENPDDDSEEAMWIKHMWRHLEMVKEDILDPNDFIIEDIRGFDTYHGPYAKVRIFGEIYEIWNIEEDTFWIKEFPISNQEEEDEIPGFRGYDWQISGMIRDIEESGGIETYLTTKKYNL